MTIRTFKNFTPKCAKTSFVDEMALVIGQVTLAEAVSIWPMCVLRGDVNYIEIGAKSNIQDGTVIHVNHQHENNPAGDPVIIGEAVTVGHQATIHGCTIADRVLIGIGAIIMDKAVIQKEVVVGAGSLVPPNKTLESGYLYLGAPAKKIRKLSDAELEHFIYSADHYVALKNEHAA